MKNCIVPSFFIFPFDLNKVRTFPVLPVSPTWSTDSIPKIIHQTAPGDRSKWNPIWEPCQESWITKFPDYEYKLWTDEDLEEFIRTKYEWFYPTYMGYEQHIKRIDSARYFILYEYGGIYADMDYECLENFESELPRGKLALAESKLVGNSWYDEEYQNALMACPAHHPCWNYVFQKLEQHKDVKSVLWATGPVAITKALEECPELVHGLSYDEFTHGDVWAKHYGTQEWISNPITNFITKLTFKQI